MAGEFLVQFWSADLTGPQLVGSFHFDESAESFCDEQNERLALWHPVTRRLLLRDLSLNPYQQTQTHDRPTTRDRHDCVAVDQ